MIAEVIISDIEHECCVCGKPTRYIEINYQAPFCSDECIHEMDKQSKGGNMNKEKIIKEIEECFDDMKNACEREIGGAELIPLFRDYTDEIIKIVNEEK